MVAILVSAVYAIIEGARRGYADPLIIVLFAVCAVSACALVGYERRRAEPLIDPVFFGSLPFSGATVAAVAAFVAMAGFLFLNTLYLQDVRGYSPLHAGLLTVPMAVATMIASPLSGHLTATRGPRMPMISAGVLLVAATAPLTRLTPTTPTALLLAVYLLFGIGFGLVNAPITNAAVSGMPRAQAGVSAAITATSRQVGSSLGVAVLGSVIAAHTHGRSPDAFTTASHTCWWILAGCGALVATVAAVTTTARAHASAVRVGRHFASETSDATAPHAEDSVPSIPQRTPPTAAAHRPLPAEVTAGR